MIKKEDYRKFVASFNGNSKPGANRNNDDQRFGQHFMNTFGIRPDAELFYKEDRNICEQIIQQRYLHPRE